MSQTDYLRQLDAVMYAAFAAVGVADRATYRAGPAATPVSCTVTVDSGVQLASEVVTTDQTVIRVLLAEVGQPRQGAVITILDSLGVAAAKWRVDRVESQDESAAVLVVRRDS